MSKRSSITKVLADLMNTELDGIKYPSNIYGSAENKIKFWDEISNFPYISIVPGSEYREYMPGHFKWAYLTCIVRIYTKGEDSDTELDQFFDDIEQVLDLNNEIIYSGTDKLTSITIATITSDEGVLKPLGIGEMTITTQYELQGPCPI